MVEGFVFAGGEDVNWQAVQNQKSGDVLGVLFRNSRRLLRDQGGWFGWLRAARVAGRWTAKAAEDCRTPGRYRVV